MYFSRSRIRLISGLLFLVTNHTRKEKVFLTKHGEKMLYEISGNQDSPVILMFPGSFGSARSMQGYMRRMMDYAYALADERRIPVILDTDDRDKAARYEHLGMKLDRVRSCGEQFHMYDLVREYKERQ